MQVSDQTLSYVLKNDLSAENVAYLRAHPEIESIISGFINNLLSRKPANIHLYVQEYFAKQEEEKEILYTPLVISGPSGVGKGTLLKMLLDRFPDVFELSVSYTTRKPRPGEVNGVQYNFVSPEEFSSEIPKNSFIEYTEVHGNYYGTHRGYVRKVMEKKKICILEIDVVGAQKVSKSGQVCNYVFINPPSMEELKRRLSGRGTEKEDVISLRMTNAVVELEMSKNFGIYDKFLVNDELESTFKNLISYINEKYPGLNLKA